jgi:hypothetical protein
MGFTYTTSHVELAALADAIINSYSHIATESLITLLRQIKKQLPPPNFHRHHTHGDVYPSIAKAIRQSPSPIHHYKVSC